MASSIPGAIKYWIQLATTTLTTGSGPNPPYVWFGTPLSKYVAPITLQIQGAVDITREWAQISGVNTKVEEHYRIRNQLCSYAGGNSTEAFQDRMDEVFATLDVLGVALSNNSDLGGNVRLVLPMSDGEFVPGVDPHGYTLGSLMFDIYCEARVPLYT